jgi:hypothetical protein
MPNDYEGWIEHYKKQIETPGGAEKLKIDLRLENITSPPNKVRAAKEVFMEYKERQAQEAVKRQQRHEEETLKVARRENYIAWFIAMGALISGFTAIAIFFESLG